MTSIVRYTGRKHPMELRESTVAKRRKLFQEEKPNINDLPFELICEILEVLPPSADRTNEQVCRLWNGAVKVLHDPTLKVFGKEAWEEYYDFKFDGEVPPLPKGISVTTRSLRRRLAGKKEAPPCTAILMPKGLTLNKLKGLMENPIKGKSTKFSYIWDRIVDKLGDKAVEKSYWFVMTNDVIEGSRHKSYADQKALVEQKTGSECQLPTLLEVIACCVMHLVSSKKYLFGRDPGTYTRCQEQIGGWPLAVGGFASGGLDVYFYSFVYVYVGAAASRKFC